MANITPKEIIAWIDETGKTGAYDYLSNSNCALSQYLEHIHPEERIVVGGYYYNIGYDNHLPIPEEIAHALCDKRAETPDYTFEGLRARLEMI